MSRVERSPCAGVPHLKDSPTGARLFLSCFQTSVLHLTKPKVSSLGLQLPREIDILEGKGFLLIPRTRQRCKTSRSLTVDVPILDKPYRISRDEVGADDAVSACVDGLMGFGWLRLAETVAMNAAV